MARSYGCQSMVEPLRRVLVKRPEAAFAAALAGWLLLYVAVRFGWGPAIDVRRASAGVVVAQFLVGLIWAGIGYWWARREL